MWLDAPIGYLCSFKTLCAQMGEDFAAHLVDGTQTELHHFIGKDIVNFHGLFWPAVLHGTGHRAPTRLHVNGYLTVDGAKMSKSRGTFVMARTFLDVGLEPEALRYYFAAKSSGGVDDLDLNLGDFIARVNADLVGKFVNLASRCAGFIGKRFDGKLAEALPDAAQYDRFVAALAPIREAYERNDAASAIRQTMALADEANKYIDDTKPWVIAKQDSADAQLQSVCTQGLNLFRVLVAALKPILPRTCAEAEAFLSAPMTSWEDVIRPLTSHDPALHRPVHPYRPQTDRRHDRRFQGHPRRTCSPATTSKAAPAKPDTKPAAAANPQSPISNPSFIGMDDFAKLDLRIGKVLVCECVEGSDKLLRFELDAGELGKRQIFSGIRASYGEPEALVGRSVVFIANLAPRKMRFGISDGMILSAGFDGGALALLDADSGAQPGMPVR